MKPRRRSPAPAGLLPAVLALLVLAVGATAPAVAIDTGDTLMLTDPATNGREVAFSYAGDLWICPVEGGAARRLTSYAGQESSPRFSPDGQTIAFSGEYDGNVDVYVMPAAGGEPQRLTWHPGEDRVQGWTPDGEAVLFTSARGVHTRRWTQLLRIGLDGGLPEALPAPSVDEGCLDATGRLLAYNPIRQAFREWKNYRGGTASRIWVLDLQDLKVDQVAQPEGRCNDVAPMWVGGDLYFLSDRDGEFNLFVRRGDGVERLTTHEEFPIQHASAGGGLIVYEQAGRLHLFDPATGASRPLRIGVAADLVETRPRWIEGAEWVRNADVSPSGARAVLEFRGEIVTLPAEKGEPRNLTASPGVHDRSPVWSPDGARIAWFSDEGGEYALHVAAQDGRGERRTYVLGGAGFYDDPRWSPDGRKLSFTDNSWTLYWLDLDSGRVTRVDQEQLYGPFKGLEHAWSPDSRWLAYTHTLDTNFRTIRLYSLDRNESWPVSDGLSDASAPAFDGGGKYLYFYASTDAGPLRQWFAMSNADMQTAGALYLAVLPADEPSPLAPRSDEEEGAAVDGKDGKAEKDDGKGDDEVPPVRVDRDRLDQRILALPLPEARYRDLQAGPEGQLYYLRTEPGASGRGRFGSASFSLCRYDLGEREEEVLAEGIDRYRLAADGEKILVQAGDDWRLLPARGEAEPGQGALPIDRVRVRIEPRAEWAQMYDEVWRINRDYFYDPGMHGADWPAMRERYARFLPHLSCRDDLTRVISWLGSEVSVGHHRCGGGDSRLEADRVPGGLLGADLEVHDGRYRFARVYGGLNWNPELRSPLTEPGVDVREGEYLLAVRGTELRPPRNPYAPFENTADHAVEITVGPRADGKDSRTVTVVPIANEGSLRSRAWVEGNRLRVEEATGGRVAYVWLPNTTVAGHEYFKRYFFPQADREAIIVDERHNGGGQVADYYLDLLRRPLISYWATRYGEDFKTPLASIQGPKVMLIDETAGSGGDLLPWMWRKLEMGKLIGRRTWGGLVGVLGFPVLMDGGYATAPNLAIWTPEGGWVVENVGVPPDIEVEMDPAAVAAGKDPQLERAIAEVMAQLPPEPPAPPRRPDYPVRVRR